MINWKTTLSGLIGGVALIVNSAFGVEIPTEGILAVALFFVGLFSKDASNEN